MKQSHKHSPKHKTIRDLMVSELQCSGQYFVVSVVSAKKTTELVTFVISHSERMSTPSFTGSFIQVSLTQAPL